MESRQQAYLLFDSIPAIVTPEVRSLVENPLEASYFTKGSENVIGFRHIFSIYRELRNAVINGEDRLVDKQPSVQKKKKEIEEEKKAYKKPEDLNDQDREYFKSLDLRLAQEKNRVSKLIGDFSGQMIGENYSFCMGAIDYEPDRRIKDYNLPEGKNAVFYDNPKLKNGELDLGESNVHLVDWPVAHGKPTRDLIDLLGRPVGYKTPFEYDFYVLADKQRVINQNDGLALVCCRFGMLTNATIDSVLPLSTKSEKFGLVLGRMLDKIER